MELPITLRNRIVEYLKSLPNLDSIQARQAFISSVDIDSQLKDQIVFDGPSSQFFPFLVSTLSKCEQGVCAIIAVLESSRSLVGQDKRVYCTCLIELLSLAKELSTDSLTVPQNNEKLMKEEDDDANDNEKELISYPFFLSILRVFIIIMLGCFLVFIIGMPLFLSYKTFFAKDPHSFQIRLTDITSQQMDYFDFERSDDLQNWRSEWNSSAIFLSSEEVFSGKHAMAITLRENVERYVIWEKALKAEVIMGQVFWPTIAEESFTWAEACIRHKADVHCEPIPRKQRQWNTFIFDLNQLEYDGQPLSTLELTSFWFHGGIAEVGKEHPYTFYVDGIQIFYAKP